MSAWRHWNSFIQSKQPSGLNRSEPLLEDISLDLVKFWWWKVGLQTAAYHSKDVLLLLHTNMQLNITITRVGQLSCSGSSGRFSSFSFCRPSALLADRYQCSCCRSWSPQRFLPLLRANTAKDFYLCGVACVSQPACGQWCFWSSRQEGKSWTEDKWRIYNFSGFKGFHEIKTVGGRKTLSCNNLFDLL